MWCGVAPRIDTKRDGLCAQNMVTILGSTININGGGALNDHSMSVHFDNE